MRHWMRRTLFGLFGASLLVGGLAACSHHRDGQGWHASAEDSARFRERMIDRVSDKLDLSAEQKQRLAVLADRLREQREALAGTGGNPRSQVQALVSGDKFDRAKAQALVGEKTAALNAKSPEVIAAAADFYDSLNTAQQQKVRDFMQRRHGWWSRG